jgi:hypothetical protein
MFRIIQDLVSEILVDAGALYKASEAVRMFIESHAATVADLVCVHLGCTA